MNKIFLKEKCLDDPFSKACFNFRVNKEHLVSIQIHHALKNWNSDFSTSKNWLDSVKKNL